MPQLLGAKMRHLRTQQDLSQNELARRLQLVTSGHVNRIESGQNEPSVTLLLRLCALLHTSSDYLLRDGVPVEDVQRFPVRSSPADALSWERFGSFVRQQRIARGLSQRAFKQQLDLQSHSFISMLEAGKKSPSLDMIVRLADVFVMSCDDLLREGL